MASIYSPIANEFHENVAGLGYASSLFFLGVLSSEIPGGVLASRYGAKKVVLIAVLLTSISVTLSAFSMSFNVILVSRLLAGIGVGASFPPFVGLTIQTMRKGASGVGIGLISLSFNLGGVGGLLGWAVIASAYGWRLSLFVSGGLGILCVPLLFKYVHEKAGTGPSNAIGVEGLRKILSNRKINIITLALIGLSASATLVWSFMVYFLEGSLNVAPGLAGLISGLGLLFSITAPFVGRAYEKTKETRGWLILAAIIVTVGVAFASLDTILSSIISVVLVGIGASMGYTVALTAASDITGPSIEYQSIAVGWMDSSSIVGGFISPIIFSLLVLSKGYEFSWMIGSFFSLFLAIPMLLFWKGMKKQ